MRSTFIEFWNREPPTNINERTFSPKRSFNPPIPKTNKTFIISNSFPILRREFFKKGWRDVADKVKEKLEKEDFASIEFDFSYYPFDWETRQRMDNSYMLNTFNGMLICSKKGMVNVLKSAQKYKNLDIDWFFPRCFDVSEKYDLQKFFDYFFVQEC